MSEIPETNARLLAEVYGWAFDRRFEITTVNAAADAALADRPALDAYCERMREWYADTDDGYGPVSWRDFRYSVAWPALGYTDDFDRERVFYEIHGRIRAGDVPDE